MMIFNTNKPGVLFGISKMVVSIGLSTIIIFLLEFFYSNEITKYDFKCKVWEYEIVMYSII